MNRARWILAGAAALLVTASAFYLTLVGRPVRLYALAAMDHRREVVNKEPQKWANNPFDIGNLAHAQAVPPPVVLSLSPAGYRIDRGKLCRLNDHIFLHLVYQNHGAEFSVYFGKGDSQPLTGTLLGTVNGKRVYGADVEGDHVAYFRTPELTAIFIAAQSGEALSMARLAAGSL